MNKIYKQIVTVLVVFALTINLLPALRVNAADEVASGKCGANLTWSLDSEGMLTISGEGEMNNWNFDEIIQMGRTPWREARQSITSVTIDDGVTSIGDRAFYNCTNLKTITIPDSITSIGTHAFYNCTSLESITIPDSVTSIGEYVFYECTNLKTITIPAGVTSIGEGAFYTCTNLKTITIPESVTSIEMYAFRECTNLKIITIPDSVTSIGKGAFEYCTSLESISIPNSVTSIGDYAFNGCAGLNRITIPNSVTSIGSHFSEGCTSLESISLPDSVIAIGDYAFRGCTSLESITIPNSVTSIGNNVFRDCTSLKTVTIPDSVTSIGKYLFIGCTNLENITIPNSVTSIGEAAFYECTSLENITIPDSVTSIGLGAFYGCTGLESITIPESVTSIDSYVFMSCTSLENITIPDSVTSIGREAFHDCTNLESITIPDSVTSMSHRVFEGCTSLESILLPKNCSMGVDVFKDCNADLKLYYYYDATYTTDGNGEVTGKARSYFGDELTITPDPYFVIDQVTYKDANGKEGSIDPDADGRYFMPDSDSSLTVIVSFKRIKADVTFLSEDGKTELQSSPVDIYTVPSYEGEEPEKEPDAQYTYSFAGWTDGTNTYGSDEDLPPVTDNIDYKAVFESTTNKYTIEFVDEDGKVLQTGEVDYGTTPSYGGTTPVKAEDEKYTYEFSGWSPAILSVTGDATYKAVFTSTEKSEPTNTPIKKDDTPTPVTTPGTYYLKSMVEQDGNIIFTIKQSEDDTKTYDLLGTVSSDGTKLTAGDQYTAEKGSAIITVKKSYLDTLTAGNHKLTVTFTDGGSITITYEVKAPTPAPEVKPVETKAAAVSTGEVVAVTTVAGSVMLIISCGIILTVLLRRRRANG